MRSYQWQLFFVFMSWWLFSIVLVRTQNILIFFCFNFALDSKIWQMSAKCQQETKTGTFILFGFFDSLGLCLSIKQTNSCSHEWLLFSWSNSVTSSLISHVINVSKFSIFFLKSDMHEKPLSFSLNMWNMSCARSSINSLDSVSQMWICSTHCHENSFLQTMPFLSVSEQAIARSDLALSILVLNFSVECSNSSQLMLPLPFLSNRMIFFLSSLFLQYSMIPHKVFKHCPLSWRISSVDSVGKFTWFAND